MLQLLILTMILLQDQSKNKRVIVLYSYNTSNAAYQLQIKLLAADKPGLIERDIIVKNIIYNNDIAGQFKTQNIKGDFTFILFGKDGGEKLRGNKAISLEQLYGLIDAMPMRRAEMRRRGQHFKQKRREVN